MRPRQFAVPEGIELDFEESSVSLGNVLDRAPFGKPIPVWHSVGGRPHPSRSDSEGHDVSEGHNDISPNPSPPLVNDQSLRMVQLTQSIEVPEAHLVEGVVPLNNLSHNREVEESTTDKFGSAHFIVVTTKPAASHFHWIRRPSLRQEWMDVNHSILRRDEFERKASLMELYYDLIFVAVIALLGHSLRLQATLTVNFFVEYIALFHIWLETVMYLDRFDQEDGLSRILILLTMAGVVGMGLTGQTHVLQNDDVGKGYAISFIWARTAVEVMYLTGFSVPAARRFVLGHFITYIFVLAFWIASIWAPTNGIRIGLQVCGFGIGLIGPGVVQRLPARIHAAIPVNLEHVTERFSLFTIIIIGETIVSLLFVESGAYLSQQWGAAGLGLLLSFSLQWIAFDIDNGTHGIRITRHALRRGGIWALLWIYSHIPAHLGIMCAAAGIWNVHHYYGGAVAIVARAAADTTNTTKLCNSTVVAVARAAAETVYDPLLDACVSDPFFYGRWLLCSGCAAALLFVTLSGVSHKHNDEEHLIKMPIRIILRLCSVLIMALVPLAGKAISPLGYLGICCSMFAGHVIIGLEHKKSVHKVIRAVSIPNVRPTAETTQQKPQAPKVQRGIDTQSLLASLEFQGLDLSRILDVQVDGKHHLDLANHENAGVSNANIFADGFEYESR